MATGRGEGWRMQGSFCCHVHTPEINGKHNVVYISKPMHVRRKSLLRLVMQHRQVITQIAEQ